jgi:tRNA(adenine34) deaminase
MDDVYFMEKALQQAESALAAGEFPVACVMVAGGAILATGARSGSSGDRPNEVDHAEMVALRRLNALDAPVDPAAVTAYTTMEPCLMCFAALILSRVGRVVWAYEDVMGGGTTCDLATLPSLYRNSPIVVVSRVLRDRSLALFKRFFATPQNTYWRGSLLAAYTLGAADSRAGCETA